MQAVADQVAVALSHAAVLEESQARSCSGTSWRSNTGRWRARGASSRPRLGRGTAARGAPRDAVATPMHAIVGLLSVMQQEAAALRLEQRLATDAIARTSALSSALVDHVMETLTAEAQPAAPSLPPANHRRPPSLPR